MKGFHTPQISQEKSSENMKFMKKNDCEFQNGSITNFAIEGDLQLGKSSIDDSFSWTRHLTYEWQFLI